MRLFRKSVMDKVVRHQLQTEELAGIVDVLTILLRAGNGVRFSGPMEQGPTVVDLPPSVRELFLDALSLLASRGRTTLVAVDDTQYSVPSDISRVFKLNGMQVSRLLDEFPVPKSTAQGHENQFVFADVIETFRGKSVTHVEEIVIDEE